MKQGQVSKSEFKARALEYLRQVESSGESITITDHGKPVIEVRPYHAIGYSPLNALKGSVKEYVDPTEPLAPEELNSGRG